MRQAYDADLTDREWEITAPMPPEPYKLGRSTIVDMREVMNGIFYILKNGCTWQNLPHDSPSLLNTLCLLPKMGKYRLIEEIKSIATQNLKLLFAAIGYIFEQSKLQLVS
jgi:putative transposase